ncbi:winged helix DNA-binding domain-containing protein [Mycolicibacterium confluentis]|uniref:Uncharacterized protein n=1 Tax=Mycolicibacterium confluentis TaxID=28047 RepID=A0A7I7XVJ5_9MYCO|nr:winged helix DNA-binding domain-containing protein [Mycolicibacterium confluentis]MCV7322632.1 AlkZ family DNA glycosylase [Mycolicibacterium confluentis]ORV32717.1 hypothetical protein AWB99_08850 [Mycolicibacterium confluentis]BBZ33315.1 hypothetical protein MCNF_19200 [Mycolicibacterium confluentis]
MRTFSPEQRRARLAQRHFLTGGPAPGITDLTRSVVGLHATDPATPYLSLWARVPEFRVEHLDAELYERRSVVKHLAMRRTLWVLPSDQLEVVQSAASDRVADNERRKLIADVEKAGVANDGAAWLETAARAVHRHLGVHEHASSAELRAALPELAGTYDPAPGKRWGGQTHLAPRILTFLSANGELVRGPNDSTWTNSRPRWVSTGGWLGRPAEPADHLAARDDLVRRWLHAFGPATEADIKWWFGTTLTATRQALAAVEAVEVDLDGTPGYVLPTDLDDDPQPKPWAALLPGLDVATMGWAQRDWYLGDHKPHVFDTNGNAGPTAWWNGRIVGGWHQNQDARVEVTLLEDIGRQGREALSRKADELTAWLDGTRISPRFPSPLSKSAR